MLNHSDVVVCLRELSVVDLPCAIVTFVLEDAGLKVLECLGVVLFLLEPEEASVEVGFHIVGVDRQGPLVQPNQLIESLRAHAGARIELHAVGDGIDRVYVVWVCGQNLAVQRLRLFVLTFLEQELVSASEDLFPVALAQQSRSGFAH